MAEVILMPRLSDTMTEGVIAEWHKKVGDAVKKGDVLADIETDKATMELESYKDGILLHLGADKGGTIQVNDLLAIIGKEGEDITEHLKNKPSAATGSPDMKKDNVTKEDEQVAKGEGDVPPQKDAKKEEKQPETSQQSPKSGQGSKIDISKMDEVVLMPRLSDTMTEGVIAGWHKQVGDDVKKGDVLADIETDKATMELESYKNGKLLHQGAKEGEKIAVNDLLCIIGDETKIDVNAIVAAAKGGGQASEVTPEPKEEKQSPSTQQATEGQKPVSDDGRIKASPLAKKLAKEKGIDLARVEGSGDNGRIIKSDIDNFVPSKAGEETQKATISQSQHVITGE